jgi:hypothetical protein
MVRHWIVAATALLGALSLAPLAFVACARSSACRADAPSEAACAGCPRFASGDAARGCTCAGDSVLLAGGCVSRATADAFCGTGAHFETDAGACVLSPCPDGQPLDVATGACIASQTQREIAAADHILLVRGEALACKGDRPPLFEGSHASCVPDDALCPRGTRFVTNSAPNNTPNNTRDGAPTSFRCEREPRCFAGEIADPDSGACTRVLQTSRGERGDSYRVDVARWARAVIGPDGGQGRAAFCAPLEKRPSLLGLTPDSTARVRVMVELFFPNDDVTEVYARVTPFDETAGRSLTTEAEDVLQAGTRPFVEALRALGGEAAAGALRTTVRCIVTRNTRPIPFPLRAFDAGADDPF